MMMPDGPLVLDGHAQVRAVLMDSRFAIHKPLTGTDSQAAMPTGQAERSRRIAPLSRVLATHLSASHVHQLSGLVTGLVGQRLADGLERGGMELVADLAGPVPVLVMMALLGLPTADIAPLAPLFDAITAGHDVGNTERDRMKAYFALDAIGTWVEARRAEGPPSALQEAIAACARAERIPAPMVTYWLCMLLYAGSTTTRDFLVNLLVGLLEHPDAASGLGGASPPTLKIALEELLRLEGPVRMVGRVLREPMVLDGQALPAGAQVYLNLEQANRDATQFANPLTLDLARSPNPHLAFGTGVTFCLGAKLARLEAMAVLQAFLPHLSRMELQATPVWGNSRVLRGRQQASIRFR